MLFRSFYILAILLVGEVEGKTMKKLFKQTRVIYDAHLKEYQVYYKNWFVWKFDSCYRFDERDIKGNLGTRVHYCEKQEAENRAIARAKAMLETVEVYRGKQVYYY